MVHENYLIRKITMEDESEIITLQKDRLQIDTLRKSYIYQNKANISPEEETQAHKFAKSSLEKSITEYPCLVAVHKESKKIVGMIVLANGKGSIKPDDATSIKCKMERNVVSFLNFLIKNAKIDEKFPKAKNFIKVKYLFIHKDHGQKGLATSLMQEAIKWGKENDFDLLYGNFSSAFSQKAARKAELNSFFNYDIRDYRDFDGSQIFADAGPHNVVSTMAIDLHQ